MGVGAGGGFVGGGQVVQLQMKCRVGGITGDDWVGEGGGRRGRHAPQHFLTPSLPHSLTF